MGLMETRVTYLFVFLVGRIQFKAIKFKVNTILNGMVASHTNSQFIDNAAYDASIKRWLVA